MGVSVTRSIIEQMKKANPIREFSPIRIAVVVVAFILLCDFIVMAILNVFPDLPEWSLPIIDSFLLVVLLLPVVYFFVYRPAVRQIEDRKKNEEALRQLALFDDLTGLYNRRGFLFFAQQILKLANRTQRGILLVFADMDNMKQINDTHGHSSGDAALASASNVLKETFRRSDVIARIGGDEFAVLALEAKQESMDVLRERLQKNLQAVECGVKDKFMLAMSMGIVYYDPQHPCSMEELLHKADLLMYEQKRYEKQSKTDSKPVAA